MSLQGQTQRFLRGAYYPLVHGLWCRKIFFRNFRLQWRDPEERAQESMLFNTWSRCRHLKERIFSYSCYK